jgi:predicted amidohydrolase YtcJ
MRGGIRVRHCGRFSPRSLAPARQPYYFGRGATDRRSRTRRAAVFVNGKVITNEDSSRIVEALASKDGRFTAVGSLGDVYGSAGPRSRVVDLQGRTVVPGFVDGHAHMDREGLKFLYPSFGGVRSIDDVLDRVAPHNPVYIKGGWFYWNGESPIVSIANRCALALAGLSRDTLPPHVDLEIGKDVDGEPNLVFSEAGATGTFEYSLMRVVPQFSHDERVGALRESMRQYNAAGTTSVYEGHLYVGCAS